MKKESNFLESILIAMQETMDKHCEVFVNKEKRTVTLKGFNEPTTIHCHEEDEFDWEIGFGLALSKAFLTPKHKMMREMLRNKNRKLDYKTYAKWCIIEYFEGNEKRKNKFYEENVKFYEGKKNKDK